MSYCIQEIEVTALLPRVVLAEAETGVALVVRRQGAPIGLVLRRLVPGSILEPADFSRLLHETNPSWLVPGPPAVQPAPSRLPSLTAAVCTHDRPELLALCLASLRALRHGTWGRRIDLELLVVDNAPSDERTQALVATLADVRYVREPHCGLDFARNRAWREARGEFVAYFDDDVTVDPGWLDGYVEAFAEHPDAAAITGPVLPSELLTPAQILFEEYGGFGHRFTKTCFGPTRPGDPIYPCSPGLFGSGCNMALRRDALAALGGFDEALDTGAPLPGGGDLDVFYRLVRGGHVVVVEPRCLVFHRHRRDYRAFRHQMWTWGLGAMAFVAKTYRTDPANRPRLRRLVRRWFDHRARTILACALGRGSRPIGVEIAHTAGGIVGLLGEYRRSLRRVAHIRAAVEATDPACGHGLRAA